MPSEMEKLRRHLATGEDVERLTPEQKLELGDFWPEVRRFVLAQETEFAIRPYADKYKEKKPGGECFVQSMAMADNWELTYVEGHAICPRGRIQHHASCEDADGLVRLHLGNEGLAYLGICFRSDYVRERYVELRGAYELRRYSLLDDAARDSAGLAGPSQKIASWNAER
jgi:hypothetical protein